MTRALKATRGQSLSKPVVRAYQGITVPTNQLRLFSVQHSKMSEIKTVFTDKAFKREFL